MERRVLIDDFGFNLTEVAWKARSHPRTALLAHQYAVRELKDLHTQKGLRSQRGQLSEPRLAVGEIRRPDVSRYLKCLFAEAANSVAANLTQHPQRNTSQLYGQLRERKRYGKLIPAPTRHLLKAAFLVLSRHRATETGTGCGLASTRARQFSTVPPQARRETRVVFPTYHYLVMFCRPEVTNVN